MKKLVTISREYGSGGRIIGKLLAEKLHVPFYDKEIIKHIAEESGFSPEIIDDYDEKHNIYYVFTPYSDICADGFDVLEMCRDCF